MNWDQIKDWLGDGLVKPLFAVAGTKVTLYSIITFVVIILVTAVVSWIVRRAMKKALGRRFAHKEGTLAAIRRLTHYLIMFVGLGVALQTIGINMNALFAAGAVFAIAIGFAMQNIVQNFVSGIILLVERTIKPGDILEVDGTVIKVVEMGIRTTVARTWRDEDIIIPNSTLSQSTVKNFTLRDQNFRVGVTVGVTYGSDMQEVMRVLDEVARGMKWRRQDIDPRVLLQDFGSSSVDFSVFVSVDNPWMQRQQMSDLRKAVWFAFKDAGITIAFPQVDVHFDPPVSDALGSLGRVG